MPEQSEYPDTKEELKVEIPVAFRLAHLGIDTAAVYPKLTAQQIADILGIDGNLVRRPLKKWEIETEQMFHEHQKEYFDYYPYYTLELLREERAWREGYLALPLQVTAYQAAEAVGRSYGWSAKTLSAIYPNARRQEDGRKSLIYPRSSILKLRDLTLATPPDANWPTMPRLIEFTSHDREWILNRLTQTPIRPETRRQVVTGRELLHYPPDTFTVLQEAMEKVPPPAGDWLTVHAIAPLVGRSERWVSERIEQKYLPLGEPRLDDMGVERIHYPPSIVQLLKEEFAEYKAAGDWVTERRLRSLLGLHGVTLARIMEQVEIESEMRFDRIGNVRLHYSPETEARLAAKAIEIYDYPEADGWVTFSAARKIIGRSAKWTREQFEERGLQPETRLDLSHHPIEHYDIEIVMQIKAYADTLDAGTMVPLDDISERTGRSKPWLKPRIAKMNIQPKKRFAKSGHFIDHYPESIINDLLNI
jgi:hypothetical protein